MASYQRLTVEDPEINPLYEKENTAQTILRQCLRSCLRQKPTLALYQAVTSKLGVRILRLFLAFGLLSIVIFGGGAIYTGNLLNPSQVAKDLAVKLGEEVVEDFQFGVPYNGIAIKEKCDTIEWKKDVYFTCIFNVGELINVWNTVQTCTRYAIESGSTGFIPMIEIRNDSRLSELKSNIYAPLDYLFDSEVFAQRLQKACPQMKLYNDITEVPNFGFASMPPVLDTKTVSIHGTSNKLDPTEKTKNDFVARFRPQYDIWLNQNNASTPTKKIPTIVRLYDHALLEWPPKNEIDTESFREQFSFLLPLHHEAERLASKIVSRLRTKLRHAANKNNTGFVQGYMGAHLKTIDDAGDPKWLDLQSQTLAYLSMARERNLEYIYCAISNETEFTSFQRIVGREKITVLSKWMILTTEERTQLRKMTSDQQAIVDFLVLLKSQFMSGIINSEFSAQLKIRRRYFAQKRNPKVAIETIGNFSNPDFKSFPYMEMLWY